MFDEGGVPIDQYIIQIHNTEYNITHSTYTVDIMYYDTLTVNVSALNCVGYSDLISLQLQYDPGRERHTIIIMMTKKTPLSSDFKIPKLDTSTSTSNLVIVLSSSSAGVVIIIITAILILCTLCYVSRKSRKLLCLKLLLS